MDTLLKYAFYFALIFVVYLLVAGFYSGRITETSTVGEVGREVSGNAVSVSKNAEKMVVDTYDEIKQDVKQNNESRGDNFVKSTERGDLPINDSAKNEQKLKKMPSE